MVAQGHARKRVHAPPTCCPEVGEGSTTVHPCSTGEVVRGARCYRGVTRRGSEVVQTATMSVCICMAAGAMSERRDRISQETYASAAVERDAALREAFLRDYADLVRLARLLLDDHGAAEEVVQEAFLRLRQSWPRLQNSATTGAYLRTIVLNLSRSALRRRLVQLRHYVPRALDEPSAEDQLVQAERHQAVRTALNSLPRRQREAIVLRYYADLSEPEIAQAMQLSLGAVKSHLRRGKSTLFILLKEV